MSIKLTRFKVELTHNWSTSPTTYYYKAEASFSSKEMDFTVNLPPDISELVVKLLKGRIAEASQGALERLTLEANKS